MRILIIRVAASYMSIEKNTYNIQEIGLAKALTRLGHKCDVVLWSDDENKDCICQFDQGKKFINVFYRKGKAILKNAFLSGLEELIPEYDVIQPCEYNQLQSWMLAKKYPDKTVIYHGPYYAEFNKKYNFMCRIYDGLGFPKTYIRNKTPFITKSEKATTFLMQKGIHPEQIDTIGVGLDIDALSDDNNPVEEVNKVCNIQTKRKMLYIGRIEERRNIEFLLAVLKDVVEKDKDAQLIIVGDGEIDYVEHIKGILEKEGLLNNVVWIRKMEQKYLCHIYRACNFFLLPTRYEIFGMVMMEAMYFGNTVLTTANGGSEMLIENGVNGYILETRNTIKWSRIILETDLERQKVIGEKAHNHIVEHNTWDVLAPKFIKTYEKVM